ncbi:hypothetical protein TWF696_008508 [Orbilia brochopaga]|uniref:BTB domain-containing protein n=1 Tax=Orbilia brochopaga TaxID=3140254 RepID=A0AAV9ULR4_9PEZI
MITLKVGTIKTYYVHSKLISSASAVLDRQIKSQMKEGSTKTIVMDDDLTDEPIAFDSFTQFCYLGDYVNLGPKTPTDLLSHARIYVLAEKIEALELKNLALRKATALCVGMEYEEATALESLLSVFFDVVSLIYDGTYDVHAGKMPSNCAMPVVDGDSATTKITRDGFRLLLAKFVVCYADRIQELKDDQFFAPFQELTEYAEDIEMFARDHNYWDKLSVDYKGYLEV